MISTLQNKQIENCLLTVPEFNYGQMQRWVGHEYLRYTIEMSISFFLERFETQFETFRQEEIKEDDTEGLEELEAYKEAGWPSLIELLENDHALLKNLIIFHEYDLLHSIIENKNIPTVFYSINSIDTVSITKDSMKIEGVCFEIRRE